MPIALHGEAAAVGSADPEASVGPTLAETAAEAALGPRDAETAAEAEAVGPADEEAAGGVVNALEGVGADGRESCLTGGRPHLLLSG